MADDADQLQSLVTSGKVVNKKVKAIFKMFDQDNDDLINMDELREIFRQMGQDPTEDELIDMLVEVDED